MSRMGTVWNPWREMSRLRQEMDQLATHDWWAGSRRAAEFPAINAWENETGLCLTAELPGVDASQIDVALEKNSLTISGQRTSPADVTEENYVRRERWFEPFKRTVELPFEVNPDKCEATYEKGVLTIKLERAPEQQPKKLTIKSGN
jgi:HSP20 family protein